MSKPLLFINGKAGMLTGGPETDGVKAAVAGLKAQPEIVTGKGLRAMERFCQRVRRETPKQVLIAGGDGTVGIIVKKLLNEEVTFGLLPTGSTNNIASSLGIPEDLRKAVNVINRGKTTKADAARAGGRIFLESAGIGYLANVMDRLGEQNTKKERLKAVGHSVAEAVQIESFSVTLTVDGKREKVETVWLTVTNMGKAAALEIDPTANPTDGTLEVVYFKPIELHEAPKYMLSVARGAHIQEDKVIRTRGRSITLSFPYKTPLHIDGHVSKRSRIQVEVLPGAFTVYCP